jgi:hypothetical protein
MAGDFCFFTFLGVRFWWCEHYAVVTEIFIFDYAAEKLVRDYS